MTLLWPDVPIYEPFQAPEFLVESVAFEKAPNGYLRGFFCADETQIEMPGLPLHRIIKVRLLVPVPTIPLIIMQLAACMVDGPPEAVRIYNGPKMVK